MGGWQNGLCSCIGDCRVCCFLLAAAPCEMTDIGVNMTGGSWCFRLMCCSICPWGCCWMIGLRGDVRNKYGIDGGCCGDFCALCCCYICAVGQMKKEIETREGTAPGASQAMPA